jgi:hypothetical protein
MNTTQSFKTLHNPQHAMSTFNSSGELKIRQLLYFKKDMQPKDFETRA